MSDTDDHKNIDGFFPKSGYMTDKEIAKRLRKSDYANVRRSLIELGIEHKSICGTWLFSLESFEKLFWEE